MNLSLRSAEQSRLLIVVDLLLVNVTTLLALWLHAVRGLLTFDRAFVAEQAGCFSSFRAVAAFGVAERLVRSQENHRSPVGVVWHPADDRAGDDRLHHHLLFPRHAGLHAARAGRLSRGRQFPLDRCVARAIRVAGSATRFRAQGDSRRRGLGGANHRRSDPAVCERPLSSGRLCGRCSG